MRDVVSSPTIARSLSAKYIPMSFGQERMWFLNQFEPSSVAYNRPTVLHFQGPLDITILERSLNEILRRHQVLRTVYRQDAGQPIQEVREPTPIEIAVVDLQGVPVFAREAAAERIARQEVSRSFILSDDLMFRAQIIRFAADKHWLILTTHHIAFDGWSQGVLHDELAALYAAFRDGRTSPLSELPLQYIDYATRQRDWAVGSEASQLLEWWKHTLQGAATVLDLPTDYPRPSMQLMRGARSPVLLSKPLTDALRDLATRNQTSLFMVLMAAWNVLLHRYTGQEDILVGFPIAGRTRRETEPLIGLFMNTLPLRTNLAGNPKFRELLSRVRERALDAYANQDIPLQLLIESMSIQRDTSRAPLFQHMLVLQNAPLSAQHLGELSFDSIEVNTNTSKLDLTMELRQRPEGLDGCVEYNTDLFENATIERMVRHFITLLEGIVATPDERISQLPLLTEPERHQLLVEFNDTACEYPRELCVHELFEQQAERTPDSVALVFEGQQLSYAELNARSNRLAFHLLQHGVGDQTPVGLCLERSLDLVVSILGILKAGGIYVPLDAEYPIQRTVNMLQCAQVCIVLTQRSFANSIPNTAKRLLIEDVADFQDPQVTGLLPKNVSSKSTAYVIFTSGSTGVPKGVAVTHASAVNLLSWAGTKLFKAGTNCLLGVAPATFDISIAEFFAPLMIGGTTILVDRQTTKDPIALISEIALQKHCVVQATPATWSSILECNWNAQGCNTAISTGEYLPPSVRTRLIELGLRVLDIYGPTETTIWSTYREVIEGEEVSSIGRPISNTQVYVLDSHRELLPIGVPGELYIGGDGVARGYMNRPDLTAERFVPNRFSNNSDSKLYRTGDLCCWRDNGTLEYLSRIDHQVKLRGFRIELGEIESVLSQHPSIAQCVVILREDRPGDKRLVAYYTQRGEQTSSVLELRESLGSKLPEYMVPAAYVRLDALPLTPSGKIDRSGLPLPDIKDIGVQDQYTPARNGTEEQLAQIWSEVLGIESIGIHDNFFAMGGHSLLATRIIARISSTLQIDLPLRKLFEALTIAELAIEIATLRSGGLIANSTALMRSDRDQIDQLPLSFGQQRLWFVEQMEGELTAYNMPYVWKMRGPLDVEALRRALEEIMRRHEPLRTTFAILDHAPVQVIQPSERFELLVEDLSSFASDAQPAEIERCCCLEAAKPFNLSTDRLLRASLLHLDDDEHMLLLTMHHIASDGWSLRILWRELAGLYDTYCGGAESNLRELPVQYADYAIWQRSEIESQRIEQLLPYWLEQLKGVSVLELPTDRPRPALPTHRGAQYSFELPEALVSQLKHLSQTAGATLHMTLLAAFQTLLSRYSGQDDIAVGLPVAGRNHANLEDLIGFFVNTLVLRTDLSADPTFRELLGRVREVSLAAYDHQDLPFEKLVEELRPERQLNRSPLFQVLFQLLSFSDTGLELRNLDVLRQPSRSQRVRFDLEMHLWQQPETIRGSLVYSTDLFDQSTIERMVGHLITLLEGIVATPDERISQLPLLTEPERHQLLVEFNDTACEYPREQCVHELFEQQAERTPNSVALVFEDQQLTYRELNERANQFAHHLLAMGVGPETLVGLCLERSAELVVAILGILKAGGAYVPLDADYPPQRLEFMLRDSGLIFLVTNRHLIGRLPDTDCTMICIDAEDAGFPDLPRTNPSARVHAECLAYVMYTSGSTGIPKGVAIQHGSIVRLVFGNDYITFRPDRVFVQLATPSFDASTFELWGALLHGAKLIVAPVGVLNPEQLEKLIKGNRVTTLWLTSTLFNQLIDNHPQALNGVEEILTGGEALSVAHIVKAQSAFGPRVQLTNGYGPTEGTTFTTCFRMPFGVAPEQASIPIGRPIANTHTYVLNTQRQLVPIGVPGELYIGGVGLARGYLNRPELTAEKFVQNTFSDTADAKLYRTGDLVRWRADGNLEFLSRIDAQVKLRGFRIELGEIEAVLNEYPDVAQCAVSLREDRPDDKRLVAYYVPTPGARLNTSQLKNHLRDRLPKYMLPAALVEIEKLPLTSSGKINRRGLPAPDDSRPELETGYAIPRNPIEQQLVSIWSQVLGIQEIGIHDNFFALGGHSLLAVRLFAHIEKLFGRSLPLAMLFQHGTIGQLAELLVESRPDSDIATVLSLHPEGDGRPLFMMPTIGGGAMVSRALFPFLGSRFPIFGLQLSLAPQNLNHFRDFRATASCIVKALLKFQPHGPYALAGFSYGGMMAFEVACQLNELGENVDLLAVIDTGPGRQGLDLHWNERWTTMSRIAMNMPSWLREELRTFSASQFTERSTRKLRQLFRVIASKGLAKKELDDVFDLGRIPIQNRALPQALYDGFRDYIPRPYSGRLTLIRAQTGPLLHGRLKDLGWNRFVSSLDIRPVPGNHETIWHPPHVNELARQFSILMEGLS
jgi:amino acid adenylation domain-containing protein